MYGGSFSHGDLFAQFYRNGRAQQSRPTVFDVSDAAGVNPHRIVLNFIQINMHENLETLY